MRVICIEQTDQILLTAKKIELRAKDECFSPNEIAASLNLNRKIVEANLDRLWDRDLCSRDGMDYTGSTNGDERWYTMKLSVTVGRNMRFLQFLGMTIQF